MGDKSPPVRYVESLSWSFLNLFRATVAPPLTTAERGMYVLAIAIGTILNATIFGQVSAQLHAAAAAAAAAGRSRGPVSEL